MAITLTRPVLDASGLRVSPQSISDGIPPRRRFTREEYYRIIDEEYRQIEELDHFVKQQKYELIDGDIIEKMPLKEPHVGLTLRWLYALAKAFGELFVRCQMPAVLSEYSEPEPDVFVTRRSNEEYLESLETPEAADVLLAIEISVTTLRFDAGAKAMLYAKAGLVEYWIVDVNGRALIVHRDPTPDGYASIVSWSETETVSPLAKPEALFKVSDYLP